MKTVSEMVAVWSRDSQQLLDTLRRLHRINMGKAQETERARAKSHCMAKTQSQPDLQAKANLKKFDDKQKKIMELRAL